MFCSQCGEAIATESVFCSACGSQVLPVRPRSSSRAQPNERTRPIAGIVVAGVLGIIGVLLSCFSLFAGPIGNQRFMYIAFPGLAELSLLGSIIAMGGSTAILIGALMSLLYHPAGANVVRITSWAMLAISILMGFITGIIMLTSSAWPSIDESTKLPLIGGAIGGVIGGLVQWGLILYLFRRRARKTHLKPMRSS